jgi:hypothetical protein
LEDKKQTRVSFAQFLEMFPPVELPVTLNDKIISVFSKENDPFSAGMIQQYLEPIEGAVSDELTEFIPCFRIPDTPDIHALVYWRAGLMTYQYRMITFSEKGNLLDNRVIAGTYLEGKVLTRSIATIEEDWIIYIVSGQASSSGQTYDAGTSVAFNLELLADGKIINSL